MFIIGDQPTMPGNQTGQEIHLRSWTVLTIHGASMRTQLEHSTFLSRTAKPPEFAQEYHYFTLQNIL